MSALSSLSLGYRKATGAPKPLGPFATILFVALVIFSGSWASERVEASAKEDLHVAATADLRAALPVLADEYEKATGTHLVITYGSSSALATQIASGTPFDIFLANDFGSAEKIIAANLADTTNPTQYARGTLVLWERKDSPVQPLTLSALTDPRIKAIAIADDTQAPYGIAAIRSLTSLHLYDTVKTRIVKADSVQQAGQLAESGNAQVAFISLAEAQSPHMQAVGTYVLAPFKSYPPVNQCAVVMKNSPRAAAAHEFLNWILSKPMQEKLRTFGFSPAA